MQFSKILTLTHSFFLECLSSQVRTARTCLEMVPLAAPTPARGVAEGGRLKGEGGRRLGGGQEGLDARPLFSLEDLPTAQSKMALTRATSPSPPALVIFLQGTGFMVSIPLILLHKSFLCHFLNSVQKSHRLIQTQGSRVFPVPGIPRYSLCYALHCHLIP